MSLVKESYQSIREQLVALSVELDDRGKICDALEVKVEEERELLAKVERDVADDYNHKIEKEIATHKENTDTLVESCNQNIARKKDLLEKCKSLVARVKEEEDKLKAEVRRIHAESQREIEIERKAYRAGQEERQRKFMSAKLKEICESTERALEPEFSRLRLAHEQEVADVEMQLQADERKAKADLVKLFEDKLSAAERAGREEQRAGVRARLDDAMREVEGMEREHKVKIQQMQEDLTKELEKHRARVNSKVQREHEEGEAGLAEAERKLREKLHTLRARHEKEVRALQKEHDAKMNDLRKEFESRRESHLQSLPSSTSGVGEQGIERMKRELAESRDKELKGEIRRLQTETALLEREWRETAEVEIKRIEAAASTEDSHMKRREDVRLTRIADLSAEKNELNAAVKAALDETVELQNRVSDLRRRTREAKGVRERISERRSEMETRFNERMRDIDASHAQNMDEMKKKVNELRILSERERKRHAAELADLMQAHEDRLTNLNSEVKRDLASKDEELDTLRDAVHTEKVKRAKLKKLLARYA